MALPSHFGLILAYVRSRMCRSDRSEPWRVNGESGIPGGCSGELGGATRECQRMRRVRSPSYQLHQLRSVRLAVCFEMPLGKSFSQKVMCVYSSVFGSELIRVGEAPIRLCLGCVTYQPPTSRGSYFKEAHVCILKFRVVHS